MARGDDSLIKVGTDVRAWALGISGVNFCPGIRFLAIFDKKSEKRDILKIFNFGTLKVMKTCQVIGFWALFCPGIRFLGKFCPA